MMCEKQNAMQTRLQTLMNQHSSIMLIIMTCNKFGMLQAKAQTLETE